MKAMVFAAGRGERLRPLTENTPKALVPVAGRPMIEYPLLLLRHYGIREIIINVHHLGQKIEKYLGDGRKLGLKLAYSEERDLLDTGGGLFHARGLLEGETFAVINCDVLIDLPLEDVLHQHRRDGATATLVLREDPRADSFGPIETSPDCRIQKFLHHDSPEAALAPRMNKFMFTGVQILEPTIFRYMEGERAAKFGITTSTYPKMLLEGERLFGFPFAGFWQDLGTAERIREAEAMLARRKPMLHYLA